MTESFQPISDKWSTSLSEKNNPESNPRHAWTFPSSERRVLNTREWRHRAEAVRVRFSSACVQTHSHHHHATRSHQEHKITVLRLSPDVICWVSFFADTLRSFVL